ncbi:small nucleolar ribonucleoprotein U3 component [Tribonema minus]|uniref:U3 small nucleolar ribonucleoprotein protein IMP3 n=1 Tax=Tribonema minus TaxID=303371 RepID=A0A836CN51_9STRA|nr:small nucleolar ribonucleoprotein U3 component [Tribonema minus]|eukprot:TRINITY_DN2223_c0_g1_i2.p1 TRINITY_DN2223_c0_g1~~TRINITY_DN2223_c0_g1_i2.p1  ORF type:complete len:185 (+),score=50.96 TRINITY_DN2223_c0_g1_i2:67-621(+)
MRKLKYHEQKLLKKVDFLQWKSDQNIREIKVLRRYHIQDREDYVKYNRLVGHVTSLAAKLKTLSSTDPFRVKMTSQLLSKLQSIGVIDTEKSLIKAEQLTVSAFCRRRLPVVMVRAKMSETLREAITFIESGHIRVGPNVVTDPAFLVTRTMEDFVTWVDSSKIKRTIAKYNDKLDDFDLLGEG